ncbi:MAG: hypothetical protein JNK73_04315 [Bacteroidia bacterium]|nr:hypothetical protein [Bacteroidia bacterium]
MNSASNSNALVNGIAKIPSGSYKLAFFALPPFHLLYLYAVAVQVQKNKSTGKRTLLFYMLGLLLVSVILSAFFLINLPGVLQTRWLSGQLLLFFYGFLSLYVMFLIHLTLVTVEYERQNASHRYFEFTDIDYFTRFLTLLFLPFTIWWFQGRMQKAINHQAMDKSEEGPFV